MELNDRKKAILSAIVRMHISTGEPIGSKALCNILGNSLSSATLRNEMSALCDMGYLDQPHTSAGRVPTAEGYRFFVSTLPHDRVSEENKRIIDSFLSSSNCDPEKLPEKAGDILSELTGLPAIAAKVSDSGTTIRRVELLPMGSRSGMAIVITSDGRSRSRLFRINVPLGPDMINLFDRIVSANILRQDIEMLSVGKMQSIIANAGFEAFGLMPVFTSIFEMIDEIRRSSVTLKGSSNMFSIFGHKSDADRAINLMNSQDAVMSIISKTHEPIGIVFGDDTQYSVLKPAGLIFARYGVGDKNAGCIGIIGPTRMSYENIIPSVEYAAERMNKLLSETLLDMED